MSILPTCVPRAWLGLEFGLGVGIGFGLELRLGLGLMLGLGVEVGLGAAHHVVERLVDLAHLVGARRQLG